MTVGYRPATYTVPPARRGSRLLHRDAALRRIDWLLLARRARPVRASAGHWCGRRRGRPPSTAAATRRRSSRSTASTSRSAWCSACRARCSTTGCCGPTRRCSTCCRSPASSRCSRRWASTINGSHSWIVLPAGFSIQPSELAKVALVVGMAMLLSEKRDAEDTPRDIDVVLALAFAAVPLALVMLQPDLGHRAGRVGAPSSAWWPCPARRCAGSSAWSPAPCCSPSSPCRPACSRTTSWTGSGRSTTPPPTPRAPATTSGRRRSPIGSGGFDGQGLFHGAQTQGQFVPAQQTDFIFTVAGEELGFVGAALVVLLLGLVLWRAARIAAARRGPLRPAGGDRDPLLVRVPGVREHRDDARGSCRSPGVPLPFVSYGGSSMFANMLAVGLLQNVHMRRYDLSRGYSGRLLTYPREVAAMPVESLFPRLEPLLPQRQQADPVRRRRAQLHGQGLGLLRRPLGADVPRRLRGRRAQPGRHDPLRGAQRAPRASWPSAPTRCGRTWRR